MLAFIQFENGVTALKMMTGHQPSLFKLRQHTIHRRQAEILTGFEQGLVDIFGTHMPNGILFEQAEDLDTWQGGFQAGFFQILCFQRSLQGLFQDEHKNGFRYDPEPILSIPRKGCQMRTILINLLLISVLALSGCSIYKVDVRQGNELDAEQIAKLKIGMDRNQVKFIMGSPLLRDPFHTDRWDYIHTFRPGGGKTHRKVLTLYFSDGKLARIDDSKLKETVLP